MNVSISRDGLSKKQLLYLMAREAEVLFGGARGGGKSHVNRIGAVEDCLRYPGRNVIFVRPTIKSAREQFSTAHMSKIIPREVTDPETGAKMTIWRFNAQDSVYTFANGPDSNNPFDGGSRLILGGVTTLQDAQESYQGLEFVSIWWDELTKADWEAIQYLKGSLRDTEYDVKFRAASNPGEKSHKQVKEHFVVPWTRMKRKRKDKFPEDYNSKIAWKQSKYDEMTGQKIENTFAYIPATLDDNPIKKVRDNYLKTLMTLPDHLRKMYREGSWDTYEGKYWDDIDTTRNFVKLADLPQYDIDWEWELQNMKTFLCMDWGYQDYTAIYWNLETSKGTIVTYHELYIHKELMENVAKQVEDINNLMGVKPKAIYTPWDIYLRKGGEFKSQGGQVIGEELIDVWRYYSSVLDIKASSDRKQGWANMTQALKGSRKWVKNSEGVNVDMEAPTWLILKQDCKNLVSQIESAQIDPKNPEDILKGREDHSLDSMRMFWVAHIINPTILQDLKEPPKGTGSWIRFQMEKRQKLDEKKRKQQSVYDPGW